jgi:hypothetical protein
MWLPANKQMLHEGLQQLYHKSEWHFEGTWGLVRPKYYVLSLITPTKVRSHHVVLSGI